MDPQRGRGLALVVVGGILYSTAGLFIRALHYDAWTILAWRGLFGALFTTMWMVLRDARGVARAFALRPWQWASLPLQAAGPIAFIFALKVTTVADVMVVYATLPFVTSLVAWVWGRERPSRRILVAGSLALVGVGVMMVGSFGSGGHLLGIGLTMSMNLSFASMLVGARRSPASNTALYTLAMALSAAVAFGFAPAEHVPMADIALLGLFGFVTVGLAMALFMLGARLIAPAEVGLVGIIDVVFGPALVWLFFAEAPGLPAVAGGTVVIAALVWHLWPDLRRTAPLRVSRQT